mmetsp:Transcript_11805/g.27770  ORF Transcript_11805/g.27770 Transcript_11805/m.27770 type:complete len:201 (+) Transcript_11805:723-1325(+)
MRAKLPSAWARTTSMSRAASSWLDASVRGIARWKSCRNSGGSSGATRCPRPSDAISCKPLSRAAAAKSTRRASTMRIAADRLEASSQRIAPLLTARSNSGANSAPRSLTKLKPYRSDKRLHLGSSPMRPNRLMSARYTGALLKLNWRSRSGDLNIGIRPSASPVLSISTARAQGTTSNCRGCLSRSNSSWHISGSMPVTP